MQGDCDHGVRLEIVTRPWQGTRGLGFRVFTRRYPSSPQSCASFPTTFVATAEWILYKDFRSIPERDVDIYRPRRFMTMLLGRFRQILECIATVFVEQFGGMPPRHAKRESGKFVR